VARTSSFRKRKFGASAISAPRLFIAAKWKATRNVTATAPARLITECKAGFGPLSSCGYRYNLPHHPARRCAQRCQACFQQARRF
jgi:hypothetical protein